MENDVADETRTGCLIYDSHCRLCVAVKRALEQRSPHIEFVSYDSRKAKECLGENYQADSRPPMAYWVDEQRTVIGGLEAFFPFFHGLTSWKILMFFWRFYLCRQIMTGLYEFVAKHRYRWFGATKKS